jgi:hypothetical protein
MQLGYKKICSLFECGICARDSHYAVTELQRCMKGFVGKKNIVASSISA